MLKAKLVVSAVLMAFAVNAVADQPVLSLNMVGSEKTQSASLSSSREAKASNQFSIDFVPGSSAVAGVNFDVVFKGKSSVNIASCGAGLKSTHVARCEMVEPNRMRVLVFSAPVQAMEASSLVIFESSGSQGAQIDPSSVAVSDVVGNIISAEVL